MKVPLTEPWTFCEHWRVGLTYTRKISNLSFHLAISWSLFSLICFLIFNNSYSFLILICGLGQREQAVYDFILLPHHDYIFISMSNIIKHLMGLDKLAWTLQSTPISRTLDSLNLSTTRSKRYFPCSLFDAALFPPQHPIVEIVTLSFASLGSFIYFLNSKRWLTFLWPSFHLFLFQETK